MLLRTLASIEWLWWVSPLLRMQQVFLFLGESSRRRQIINTCLPWHAIVNGLIVYRRRFLPFSFYLLIMLSLLLYQAILLLLLELLVKLVLLLSFLLFFSSVTRPLFRHLLL